jgi:hypothetical protein
VQAVATADPRLFSLAKIVRETHDYRQQLKQLIPPLLEKWQLARTCPGFPVCAREFFSHAVCGDAKCASSVRRHAPFLSKPMKKM